MLYFDTSFLVPLVLPEATSERIAAFMRGLAAEEMAVSHWTRVEFASLLGREVRMGGLDPGAAARAAERFEAMLLGSFTIHLPDTTDFDTARLFLRHAGTGLRAGDALHLAIAANRGARTILSLDKTLLKAASLLGLPAAQEIDAA